MAETPTLDEIITAGIDARLGDVFTVTAAKVQSWDSANSTVDCIPQIRRPIVRLDDTILNEDLPVIPSVPILWSSTGNTAITFPINPGDFGLLLVLTYGASAFLDTGQPSDPGDVRAHHIANSVFLPGFGPKASKPQYAADPDMVIEMGPHVLRLAGAATDWVALSALCHANYVKCDDNFSAVQTAIATLNSAVVSVLSFLSATGPITGPATIFYGGASVTPEVVSASVAATKVKAL